MTDQDILAAWERIEARQGRLGLVALWDLGRELGALPGEAWQRRIREFARAQGWILIPHDCPGLLTAGQRAYCPPDLLRELVYGVPTVYAWIRPRPSG